MTVSTPSSPYFSLARASVMPDRRDLGVGVGDPRDAVVVDRRRVEAGEPLGDHDALAEADVGELQGRDEVADGGDGRDVGLAVRVDLDEAALHLDADLLVAELLRRPGRARRRPAAGRPRGSCRSPARPSRRSRLCSTPANRAPSSKLILRLRKARSSAFDACSSSSGTRWGRASTMVTSAPKDRQTLANSQPMTPPPSTTTEAGTRVELQRVVAGDDQRAVELQTGQRLGHRAGGQHDVAALVALPVDLDRGRADQPAHALDVGDLAALHQALQALVEPGDDAVLVLVDGRHVDALEASSGRRTARSRGRSRRPRPRAAAPWSGCSRGAGRCRRACPSRPARPAGRAVRPAGRRRSRRCLRRG